MSRGKIMVVDDSPEDLEILEMILEDFFITSLYDNAQEALQALASKPHPDLVLLDVEMPGIDGYEACEIIRNDASLSDVDVIFLSAHDSTEEIIRGLNTGGIDYITKPYDPEILRNKLYKALALRAQRLHLKKQAETATRRAQLMLTEADISSHAIRFLRASFEAPHGEQLMMKLVETLRTMELHAVAYFNSDTEQHIASTAGSVNALENELLYRFDGLGKPFIEKDSHMFVVHETVVVFVKNMPKERNKRMMLRDFFTPVVEGASARLKYFDALNKHAGKVNFSQPTPAEKHHEM